MGLKSLVKNFLNRRMLEMKMSTSLSDNQQYPDFCLKASNDYKIFNNFRANPVYNTILEHGALQQGMEYLAEAGKNPELLKQMEKFKENDAWGGPVTYEFPPYGKVSPSTLRYVKVLGDLISSFGNMNELRIAEIGVGYGGQCRIINSFFNPASYLLVDIKPALLLAQRYLDNFILPSQVDFKTMNELGAASYDLVISNYAFTELPRAIQVIYLKKIILNSRNGYITYNEITPPHFKSFNRKELLEIIPNSKIIEEIPLTYSNNCIIVWGTRQP